MPCSQPFVCAQMEENKAFLTLIHQRNGVLFLQKYYFFLIAQGSSLISPNFLHMPGRCA